MPEHAPIGYKCPICLGINGEESEGTLLKESDIVYQDEEVMAFVNSFFIEGNEGHVIVVPKDHYENLYSLPDNIGHKIFDISKKIAVAMKAVYNCDGTTIKQNNEPAGDQHAFHYHLHIYPRYVGDAFNQNVTQKNKQHQKNEQNLQVNLNLYWGN